MNNKDLRKFENDEQKKGYLMCMNDMKDFIIKLEKILLEVDV